MQQKTRKWGCTSTPPPLSEGATQRQTTRLSSLTFRQDTVSSPDELHFKDQTLPYNSHKVNTSDIVSDHQASVEGSNLVAHVQSPAQRPPSPQGAASTTSVFLAHGRLEHKFQTFNSHTEGAKHRQTSQLPSRTFRESDNAVPIAKELHSRDQTLPRNSRTVTTSDFVADHHASVEWSVSVAHIQPPEQHPPTTKGPACTFHEFRAHGRLEPPHSHSHTEGATHRQTSQLPSRTFRDNAVPTAKEFHGRDQTLPRNSNTETTSDFVADHHASEEWSVSVSTHSAT